MKLMKIVILGLGVVFYGTLILLYLFPHIFPFRMSGGFPYSNLIVFCQETECPQGFTIEEKWSFWHEQRINVIKDASPKLLRDFKDTLFQLEEHNPQGMYRLIPLDFGNYEDSLEKFRIHKKMKVNNEDSGLIHGNRQWRIEGDFWFGPTINYGSFVSEGIPALPRLQDISLMGPEGFNQFRMDIEKQNVREYFSFSSWKVPNLIILTLLLIIFLVSIRKIHRIILCWGILFVYMFLLWMILLFL